MRHETIRRIRWALGLSTVLIIAWVARSYIYNSAELRPPSENIPLLQPDVVKSSERIEYSETQGDRIVFRVSARKLVQTVGGQNQLEGIDAVNFGRNGDRQDTIQSQTGQYEPQTQFVSFKGQVNIKTKEGAEIATESLSYSKSQELARTDESFRFRRGGFSGEGQGFSFNFRTGELQIHQAADFRIEGSQESGKQAVPAKVIKIHSNLATLNRQYRFLFTHGASISQGNTRLEADEIEVHFDEKGESLQSLLARRSAQLSLEAAQSQPGARSSQRIGGESIRLRFEGGENRLQGIVSEDQAYFSFSRGEQSPIRLTAQRIDLDLDAESAPKQLTASDDAEIAQMKAESLLWLQGGGLKVDFQPAQASPKVARFDRAAKMRYLQKNQLLELWASQMVADFAAGDAPAFRSIRSESATVWTYPDLESRPAQAADMRHFEVASEYANQFNAERLEIEFDPTGNHPAAMRGELHCRLENRYTQGGERALRLITAERMLVQFVAGTYQFQSVEAGPGFQLKETVGSATRTFRSDQAKAEFAAGSQQIRRGDFLGDFRFEQGEVRAASQAAIYESDQDRIRLEGKPRLWDAQSETSARIIEVTGQGAKIHGRGQVRSVFSNQQSTGLPLPIPGVGARKAAGQGPVIVTSEDMLADRQLKKIVYSGQAKASQEADYVRAEVLELDQGAQVLVARGSVEMRLASGQVTGQGKSPSPVRIEAVNMTYDKKAVRMALRNQVVLSDGDLTVHGQRMDIEFEPQTQAVSRMTASENIRLLKNGWYGTGQETEYRISEKRLVLTGKPAEIKDSAGRRSFGRRLTLNISDDTLSVEN